MRGGMGNLMKQAQQMQQKMMKLQEEIAKKTLDASVGGGMVTVTVNGKSEVLRIKIEPQVVDPSDVEMLEDLIVAGGQRGVAESPGDDGRGDESRSRVA